MALQARERVQVQTRASKVATFVAFALLTPTLAFGRLAVAPSPSSLPTTDWLDYTLIAEDRLDIGSNLNLSGNFACWASGCSLEVALNSFQLDDTPPPFMACDTLNLGNNASVANAYTNSVTGSASGEVRGVTESQSFPLPLSMPTFPTASVCNTCAVTAGDVVVPPDGSANLSPGCYGELFARNGAAVILQPGTYTFREWDIQKFASVTAAGPVQVYIREKVATEESNFLGAASANVADFQVWIGSRKTCQPSSSATNSVIGKFSVVIGTFVAPEDDDFNFNKSAVMMGTTIAKEIDVRGTHEDRPATPTPTSQPTPTPTPPVNTPTPTPPVNTPTPTPPVNTPTPTPPGNTPTPTPTGTPSVNSTPTPTPALPTPTPTQPFVPPTPTPTPNVNVTPTPNGSPTPSATRTPRKLPTPTPTQPFVPPTPTPEPSIAPPPPTVAPPRKHPWGKKSGLIESLFPSRTGSRIAPSMKRPMGVRRR